jgi:uncharacterized phage protein (TIGR02220 family)
LEILRSQPDFKYPIEDIDLLADEMGVSEQKARVVICNYNLFNVDCEDKFFSPKLIEYIAPYLEAKKRNSINGKLGNLKRYYPKIYALVESGEMSIEEGITKGKQSLLTSGGDSGGDRENSQRKGKERKVNEKKELNNGANAPHVPIVEYLNAKLGSKYLTSGKKTKALIQARLNEGFTVDDFMRVIDKKVLKWKGDVKMEQYLRPETLFGTKFESYLNEPEPAKKPLFAQ